MKKTMLKNLALFTFCTSFTSYAVTLFDSVNESEIAQSSAHITTEKYRERLKSLREEQLKDNDERRNAAREHMIMRLQKDYQDAKLAEIDAYNTKQNAKGFIRRWFEKITGKTPSRPHPEIPDDELAQFIKPAQS